MRTTRMASRLRELRMRATDARALTTLNTGTCLGVQAGSGLGIAPDAAVLTAVRHPCLRTRSCTGINRASPRKDAHSKKPRIRGLLRIACTALGVSASSRPQAPHPRLPA